MASNALGLATRAAQPIGPAYTSAAAMTSGSTPACSFTATPPSETSTLHHSPTASLSQTSSGPAFDEEHLLLEEAISAGSLWRAAAAGGQGQGQGQAAAAKGYRHPSLAERLTGYF
jgi:hypothetical protein